MSFVFLVSSALKNITLVENVIFELEALLGMILIRVLNLVVKSDRSPYVCCVIMRKHSGSYSRTSPVKFYCSSHVTLLSITIPNVTINFWNVCEGLVLPPSGTIVSSLYFCTANLQTKTVRWTVACKLFISLQPISLEFMERHYSSVNKAADARRIAETGRQLDCELNWR